MRIAIASDHAAIDLKAELRDWLIEQGHEVADLGPETTDSVDYPDFGYKLASVVADGTAERGVAGTMAVVLAVYGAGWGLAAGVVLYVLVQKQNMFGREPRSDSDLERHDNH
mgnify:CR=1 FL=1